MPARSVFLSTDYGLLTTDQTLNVKTGQSLYNAGWYRHHVNIALAYSRRMTPIPWMEISFGQAASHSP